MIIDRTMIRPEGSDCTAPYSVKLSEECTVKEFVDTMLKQYPKEWGYIGIYDGTWWGFGKPRIEFRRGEIISEYTFTDIENSKIKSVFASGGWSNMNWRIEVE